MILTLEEAKAHLRTDSDADDLLIQDCIDAAEDHIAQYLGRSVPWTDDDGVEVEIPASVKQAAKLLVGGYYADRESQSTDAFHANPAVDRLLHFYRIGIGV